MAKVILEFDENELDDAIKAITINKMYSTLLDFEQMMRSAEKYEEGPIWLEYKKEKKEYPDESDARNMLDAIRKVYYELTVPFRELLE